MSAMVPLYEELRTTVRAYLDERDKPIPSLVELERLRGIQRVLVAELDREQGRAFAGGRQESLFA